jgi:hypothetical protein
MISVLPASMVMANTEHDISSVRMGNPSTPLHIRSVLSLDPE